MEKIWLMANGLQFIVVIPLIPMQFPANAQILFGSLVDIANFDIVPVDLIYPTIFDFEDSDPFNFEF